MRKNIGQKKNGVVGFLIFTILIMIVSTISILSSYWIYDASGQNLTLTATVVPFIFLVLGVLFAVVDAIRRKYTVTNQVETILKATEEITNGKFDINLETTNDYGQYDYFDLIKLNINKMARELSRNEVLKTDFISSFSHEVKTPLAVIKNCEAILSSKTATEKEKKSALKTMSQTIEKLSNLITNILKLNKLENQQLNYEKKEFDLSELVRETIISYEGLIEKKDLELCLDIDEIKMVGDEFLFDTIVSNLLSNAIKFTEKGKISVALKREKEFVSLTVEDTGIGMDKETGSKIFEKFFQGDTSHSRAGNGLGLALVKKVIDEIGGEIIVASEQNKGSKFIVKVKG